jgi:PAS domain S-box-containing protein
VPEPQGNHPTNPSTAPPQDSATRSSAVEQWVQTALAVARVGVWEWDLSSDGVTWSSTNAGAFGIALDEAPKSRSAFLDLVHPDDRQALHDRCEQVVREGVDLATEFRVLSADGSIRWMQALGHVVRSPAGGEAPMRMIGVNIDITDRKSLEVQLLLAHGQAERMRTLRATMRTVQDIVSNALMSLQFFRFEAEPHVAPHSLVLFDQILTDTSAKLKALGNLEDVVEVDMVMGPGLDPEAGRGPQRP